MRKELMFGFLIVLLVGGGLFFWLNKSANYQPKINTNDKVNQKNEINKETKDLKKSGFSIEDIKKHNNENDCWLLIDGRVYDVTSYVEKHPGGKVIADYCGKDATEAFNTKGGRGFPHKPVAKEILKNFYIGDLIK